MADYSIIHIDDVKDYYEGTDVPGEFRSLGKVLGLQQLGATLIRIPPHSDFEQGTGHHHKDIEEIYIITRGSLTMRFDDEIIKVPAGSVVRVAPKTKRSHRNEGDEPVDMWAISPKIDYNDATLIKKFWSVSKLAKQKRPAKRS